MRHKAILATIGLLSLLALINLMIAVDGAREMARRDAVELGTRHLAGWIEIYRDDQGKYPASLDELLSKSGPEARGDIERHRILNNAFRDKYEYQPLTNGFVITVTAPDRWLRKGKKIEKKYAIGEALK